KPSRLSLFAELKESLSNLGEQTGRNESIAEDVWPTRKGSNTCIRPLIDGIVRRCRMRDRQDDDEPRPNGGIARCDEAGGTVLALLLTGRCFARPEVVVPDHQSGLRLWRHG